MDSSVEILPITFQKRLESLRATKLAQTAEKQALIGSMDHDDHGLILPPPERRKIVQTISSSGMPITDCLLEGFSIQPNHPSGGFFGPRSVGENYRRLLEAHPVYLDPLSSLAGGYMVNFMSYRKPHWNPDLPIDAFREEIERYRLLPGIGASQHFCQDLRIGLELGWGGLLEKIRHYQGVNAPRGEEFYAGLEAVVLGVQDWIARHALKACRMAGEESDEALCRNLVEIAEMNDWLVHRPPRTFREACQWILWYQITARMFNGSGSLGRLDALLQPYYERDHASGVLSDEEAIFHIACLLLRDTAYLQLGGPDAQGNDLTSRVSYLVLEAGHRLRIPANVGVCVGESTDLGLLRRAVEIQFADRAGYPKFLGIDRTVEGFTRLGYPPELGRQRAYSGCHWSAIPGREYTLNDCVKINFARGFEVALAALLADPSASPSTARLLEAFEEHVRRASQATARGLDF
nr:pyruvate formate lyase family protein [Anaerolinea sp.]